MHCFFFLLSSQHGLLCGGFMFLYTCKSPFPSWISSTHVPILIPCRKRLRADPVPRSTEESIMFQKKWIAVAVLATAAVSATASAADRGVNTALGAVAGVLIGNSVGGQDGAVIGGVLGAVVGNSLGGRDGGRRDEYRQQAYGAPVYYRQQPVQARPYYREARADYYGRNNYYRQDDYRRNTHRVDYRQYDGYRPYDYRR
jgi:hypothetical protein